MRFDPNTIPAATESPLGEPGDRNGQSGRSHSQITGAKQRRKQQTKCFRVVLGREGARRRKQLISRQQSHFPIINSGLCARPPFHAYNSCQLRSWRLSGWLETVRVAQHLHGTGLRGMEEGSRNVQTVQSYTNNNLIWKKSFPSLPWVT